jgi:hypothetical protein
MERFRTYTTVNLRGVSFGDAQENIKRYGCREFGLYEVVREPHNPYDPNAIKIVRENRFLGYLPRWLASRLAPSIDAGNRYEAVFVSLNQSRDHELVGLTVRVQEVSAHQPEPVLASYILRKAETM